MKKSIILIGLSALLTLSACDMTPPTADERMAADQQKSLAQGDREIGMPSILNFAEKHLLKDIYEMRDKAVPTWVYTQALDGRLVCVGQAIGFGIPYSTQYSNPSQFEYVRPTDTTGANTRSWSTEILPQAEPNGLFMPSSAAGTWVAMLDPTTKTTTPVYMEPNVVVSPFRIRTKSVSVDCEE